jgi:hypothetical protein
MVISMHHLHDGTMTKGSNAVAPSALQVRRLITRLTEWNSMCKHCLQKKEAPEPAYVILITEAIVESFNAWFSNVPHYKLSVERLAYLERVLRELEGTVRSENGNLFERINDVLLNLNFNARPYCQQYISYLNQQVRAKHTPEEKSDTLYGQWKVIAQVQCERGKMYHHHYPPVKEYISNWINEEINFIERKMVHLRHEDPPFDEYLESGKTVKLLTNMSVASLACLMRALVELGIIRNGNVTELSMIISRCFVSKRSENLSARSFRMRYYDIEDATKDSVIELLKQTSRCVRELDN